MIAVLGLTVSGCAGDAGDIIADSLITGNPALAGAPVGQPPIPPGALLITPTGLAPTAAPVWEPDPILPMGDEAFRHRRLPDWAGEPSPDPE